MTQSLLVTAVASLFLLLDASDVERYFAAANFDKRPSALVDMG